MKESKDKRIYYILPVVAGILFGTAGPFTRVLTEGGLDSFTLSFQKNLYAVIIFFVFMLLFDRSKLKINKKDIWIFMLNGFVGVAGVGLSIYVAFKYLTLSFATVLLCMAPVFVLFLATAIFKEKITLNKVICCGLAILGCYMVSDMPGIFSKADISLIGVLAGITSAFCYGVLSICCKIGSQRGYVAITINSYSFLFATIALLPFASFSQIVNFAQASPTVNNLILLGNAVCISVIPYFLQTTSLEHIEASKASILSSSEPVSAMIFGFLLFSEVPTVVMIIGMIVVIAALFMVSKPNKA